MTPNVEIMRSAKAILREKWDYSALTTLVMVLITGIFPFLLAGPLMLGFIIYLKRLRDDRENARLEVIFDGFNDFGRAFVATLLIGIFVFLWSLLLIIPGLVMSIAWSMTMFVIAEDRNISAMDAMRRSRDMMTGYKWKFFCLNLRFIGWVLLVIVTLGIASFWFEPYMRMSYLQFYEDIKADYNNRK